MASWNPAVPVSFDSMLFGVLSRWFSPAVSKLRSYTASVGLNQQTFSTNGQSLAMHGYLDGT
jgi:hypothetical protein